MSRGLCSVLQLLRRISIVKQDSAASCFTGLPIAFFHSQYGRDHIVQPLGGNYSQQIRYYAARKGKREKMEKAKKARKLKEVKKEIIVPRRFASKVQMTARARTWTNVTREPVDDVWLTAHHKIKHYSISEAIEMHRETHHPTIYNMPDAPLYMSLELNMNLEKNKYLDKFSGIVDIPHPFNVGIVKRILAFSKSEADQNAALEAGADLVGGVNLVKQIKVGEVMPSDYNYIVSHVDMLNELSNIRGILRKQYPSTGKGSMGVDMKSLIMRFKNGLEYVAEKDNVTHDFGWIEVSVGHLSMQSDNLEANIGAVVEAVCKHRPLSLGSFISIALLFCPPTREKFAIDISKYVPVSPRVADDEDADAIKQ